MITKLEENEIFVFGSNLAGRHGAGAALQAKKSFGAKTGVGAGMTGRCYAFPTLSAQLGPLSMDTLRVHRDDLYKTCAIYPEKRFLLTKVGCGLAGYPEADMKSLFENPPANLILPTDWGPKQYALVIRTCNAQMQSHGGFQWPESGHVTAPDWEPTAKCGHGLHGLLWGEGDGGLLDWSEDAKWLVCRVDVATIVNLRSKVKFPACEVIFVGDRKTVPEYVRVNGGEGHAIVNGTATAGDSGTATAGDRGTATAGYRGTATAGDRGTATAGYSGTATAGDSGTATAGHRGTATAGDSGTATAGHSGTATAGYSGTATAGDRGTATAGDSGTATAGDRGTATAGDSGVIAIQYWNDKSYKMRVATVKDEDGDGELKPNVKYRLNDNGDFVEVA